jgi:hypothetical protein
MFGEIAHGARHRALEPAADAAGVVAQVAAEVAVILIRLKLILLGARQIAEDRLTPELREPKLIDALRQRAARRRDEPLERAEVRQVVAGDRRVLRMLGEPGRGMRRFRRDPIDRVARRPRRACGTRRDAGRPHSPARCTVCRGSDIPRPRPVTCRRSA